RRLVAPDRGTRPTSERAREGLFNRLATMLDLDGAAVLDLYAGTGAVGLEALSRGAAEAVLVEANRTALAVLRRNVAAVGLAGAHVVGAPAARYLAGAPAASFDLVFADPPYDVPDEEVDELLAALRPVLRADAVVVVERAARSRPPAWDAADCTPDHDRRYGDAVLWYGRRR
ncbi:MAG: RsmD family RNA methyltransferase, partial [Jatrophihabitans sp.]|uniref:RsmD family RNA methyltransferase n=1 Tax=Jatrophihabitans sp. TaxID=1932789 RepID=UPI003F818883